MGISIGELSRLTGVKVPTIRYYEQVELLPPPRRTPGRQRRYDAEEVLRLNFIHRARDLGFNIETIRELLALSSQPDQSCATVDSLARRHKLEVQRRIKQLGRVDIHFSQIMAATRNSTAANDETVFS